jgi:hypothetical protein
MLYQHISFILKPAMMAAEHGHLQGDLQHLTTQ